MSLNCGIVGLPNVGKSTLFKALTAAPAEAANYPFCTIEPNAGVVNIADPRLQKIANIFQPKKMVPATVEFVDIAGLVKGASSGEGLGNRFLGHIRSVNAIIHVVRCFDDSNVVHVNGRMNPVDDMEIVDLELALADLEVVERRLENISKWEKGKRENFSKEKIFLNRLKKNLEQNSLIGLDFDSDEKKILKTLNLITTKPVLFVCNVQENPSREENENIKKIYEIAKKRKAGVLSICCQLESEMTSLEEEEKKELMSEMEMDQSGLEKLAACAYRLLDLETFFTAGENEVRAWTFKKGTYAPCAAGIIHSDFEKGFIKARVYQCEELFSLGSENKVKENGKLRLEGRDYIVCDGDIIHFLFNV